MKRAPRRRVASSQLSALVVLALGTWAHPALSATDADTRCDRAMDAAPISAAADSKLTIQVIDHGTNAADAISLEEATTDLSPDSTDRLAPPRVATSLRRIIDEARLRQPQFSEQVWPDTMSAPLAVEKTETVEEPTTMINTDQTDGTAELPEFSADEFLRYRQQMFRKDI